MKRRARLGSHGLLHSVQAIDAGGLAGSRPQPGHVDVESSRDYDIQQQPAEIDIATIMGGVFLGALPCMCTHAVVQLFPGRAVSRNGHIGDYVSVAVVPRPRVSTPRPPPCVPQVPELEKQASQKVAVKLTTDSQTTTQAGRAIGIPVRSDPTACWDPCLHLGRAVQWTPLRQSQSSGSPGRLGRFQPELHYRCVPVPCVGRGGTASFACRGCMDQCNRHATSEPWLGKCCLGWGATRNLVAQDAQNAQRRVADHYQDD